VDGRLLGRGRLRLMAQGNKTALIVPPHVLRQAGIKPTDCLEYKVSRGKIVILAKPDEYTPAQRRAIDARLRKAEKGPYQGPFNTADEALSFLRSELKSRSGAKKTVRK
jgi:hypothetical protein